MRRFRWLWLLLGAGLLFVGINNMRLGNWAVPQDELPPPQLVRDEEGGGLTALEGSQQALEAFLTARLEGDEGRLAGFLSADVEEDWNRRYETGRPHYTGFEIREVEPIQERESRIWLRAHRVEGNAVILEAEEFVIQSDGTRHQVIDLQWEQVARAYWNQGSIWVQLGDEDAMIITRLDDLIERSQGVGGRGPLPVGRQGISSMALAFSGEALAFMTAGEHPTLFHAQAPDFIPHVVDIRPEGGGEGLGWSAQDTYLSAIWGRGREGNTLCVYQEDEMVYQSDQDFPTRRYHLAAPTWSARGDRLFFRVDLSTELTRNPPDNPQERLGFYQWTPQGISQVDTAPLRRAE